MPQSILDAAGRMRKTNDPVREAERVLREVPKPELPENVQVAAGAGFDLPPMPVLAAALGWLALSTAIAYRFGWWLLPASVGLGLLLAGLAVMLRDGIAGLLMAYYAPSGGAEGSASKLSTDTK